MSVDIIYEKRVVCFLDILGFEKIVNNSTNQELSIKDIALEKLNIIYNTYHMSFFTANDTLQITQFSDSLVISIQVDEEDGVFWFLSRLKILIQELAKNKILCRGGVSIGDLYHHNQTICGPALIEAYKLESKIANYPRVILGQEILDIAKHYQGPQNTPTQVHLSLMKILGYDFDGFYFIDYFNNIETDNGTEEELLEYFAQIRYMIEEFIFHKDMKLRAKYLWMCKKYNDAVESLLREREIVIPVVSGCSN
jgi:hypothetical protein